MAGRILRIGTRDSQLALWQATKVQELLQEIGVASELVPIKSEGDIDTVTPLYALGVQGVFTRSLDAALLSGRIDIAVHSMKDVPTQLAQGIRQAAVLERASYKDIFVYKSEADLQELGYVNGSWSDEKSAEPVTATLSPAVPFTIATSSVRRIAQWLYRYPGHRVENLRGNVNTRLRKVAEHGWNGAIFAAAGLERIHLRPERSVDLGWMLPAAAQGAIMIVCGENDKEAYDACHALNHPVTELCTRIERDFLKTLMGGCSTPISALAIVQDAQLHFRGNICAPDGTKQIDITRNVPVSEANLIGVLAAEEAASKGGAAIVESIRKNGLTANGHV